MADDSKQEEGLSRRSFLKLAGATSLVGASLGLSGCTQSLTEKEAAGGEGWLPSQYNEPGSWPAQVKGRVPIDPNNPAITRDDEKCILCGQCLEVCQNVQTVFNNYELPLIDEIICVHCGQCALWCPSGAITEVDDIDKVLAAIDDPEMHVVVQTAPATRVALGEEFGLAAGVNVEGKQVAALRALGFDAVFDTLFTADLTIMEEGSELVKRITGVSDKLNLPQLTSCCPAWVKFVEYYYPELIPNISSAKSPQQMEGPLIKTYYAQSKGIDPEKIFSVSIMPCTAKKFECQRPEMISASEYLQNGNVSRDVDVVLTTRELARMIKRQGIDFMSLSGDDEYDSLMGQSTGAAIIFGATGGVMEAAVRSAWYLVTGEQPPSTLWELTAVRGLDGVKEAALEIPGAGEVRVAVASGLSNARKLMEIVKEGDSNWHFIEVMACPGGCIAGGGQPKTAVPPSDDVRLARIDSIYTADEKYTIRNSHDNPEIKQIYADFLGAPLSEVSHHLLHTEYESRADAFTPKED
jgi:NADH-quinone oxidoreductase subunit G